MAAVWSSLAVLAGLSPGAASAAPTCTHQSFDGAGYVVCEVHAQDDLRLFLTDGAGETIGTFARLKDMAQAQGLSVVFAMNGGMYHPDRSPVGLYIEKGIARQRLVISDGPGNFGLLPNGVFCVGTDGFSVVESRQFSSLQPDCRFATQSGPMLVIDGALHPRFKAGSDSLNIRNGVGISRDGQSAWFAISDGPVSFYDFARLFRDDLKAPSALFLDGSISRLYAPEVARDDFGLPMGPIVGLVVPVTPGGG
jgi:uncharacterized protein YigE (DUF2233 family)